MDRQERVSVTRRGFIRLGTLGAAACAAGCVGKREESAPIAETRPAGKWTVDLGLQSYSLRSFPFDDAIAKMGELGLHFAEFYPRHFPQNMKPQELAARQKKLAALDIKANAYGVCGLNNDEKRMRPLFDFCRRAGIGVITANPTPDSFALLDTLVAEFGVHVAIHNHGPRDKRWGRTQQMLDGIKGHDPGIGICLDTGHLVRAGDDPIEAVRKFGQRLHGLHFKDVSKDSTHDCIVGQGRTDLAAFFTALKEVGFDGAFSLEYESEPKNPMAGIAASLDAIRAAVAKVG